MLAGDGIGWGSPPPEFITDINVYIQLLLG